MEERLESHTERSLLFEKLPDELLSQIVSYLPGGKCLTNAALTCQHLHRLVEPLFFRYISFYMNVTSPIPGRGMGKYDHLMRILHRRPEVRSQVRRLDLEIHRWTCNKPPEGRYHVSRLLELLPSLKELRICVHLEDFETPETTNHSKPELVLAYLLRIRNLKTLILDAFPESLPRSSSTPRELSLRPSLHSLSNVTDLRFYQWKSEMRAPSLTMGQAEPIDLAPVMLALKTLRCFHFESYCPWDGSDYYHPPMSVAQLECALRPHKDTLEELLICASDAGGFNDDPHQARGPELNFADYPRLRRLGIPEPFVAAGFNRFLTLEKGFPPNIETLQLQYQMFETEEPDPTSHERQTSMEELLHDAPQRFPKLRRVIWWLQQYDYRARWTYGYGLKLDDLEEKFKNPKFEWLSESFMRDTPFYQMSTWAKEDVL